jgi:class 3 adenylate cyclase
MSEPLPSAPLPDPATLTMAEILRLQALLQQELVRRFQRHLALVFTDIVGSSTYFSRFGDVAGRQLQQLHLDLLTPAVAASGGRIVDTAGDGAFCAFDTAQAAAQAVVALEQAAAAANASRAREHQLQLRIGLHWGLVLSDGTGVSGDAVNTCARVAASAEPGEWRLTRAAYLALPPQRRTGGRPLGEVALKGIAQPVALLALDWRDPYRFPRRLRVAETGQLHLLPRQDLVVIGRQAERDGAAAADLALAHPDAQRTRLISRHHIELRRHASGLHLRAVSPQPTLLNGVVLAPGQEVQVYAGSQIDLAGVLTLHLVAEPPALDDMALDADATMLAASAASASLATQR